MANDMASFLKSIGAGKKISEKVEKKEEVEIVSEEPTSLPSTEETCPKCGHNQAYWWTKQMRASDEPETKFLKCEKCSHIWRDRS